LKIPTKKSNYGGYFFIYAIILVFVALGFLIPRITVYSVNEGEESVLLVPDIAEGEEVLFNGYKYSNYNEVLASADYYVNCQWKAPSYDDGWKICEVIFEIEDLAKENSQLTSPTVKIDFYNNNVRNLQASFSKNFEVVDEFVEEETEIIQEEVAQEHEDSITGMVVGVPESVENSEESEQRKKVIRKMKETEFIIPEEKTIVVKKRKFGEFSEFGNAKIEFNSPDVYRLVNETNSTNKTYKSGAEGSSYSNSISSEGDGDGSLEEGEDVTGEDVSGGKFRSRSILNSEDSNIKLREVSIKKERNFLQKVSDFIADELFGSVTGKVTYESSGQVIDTSRPFAVRIVFEIPKYDSNQFDFALSDEGLETYLHPVMYACGDLSEDNSIYTLNQDVSADGDCFLISGENVTLDCQGHLINYAMSNGHSSGVSVLGNQATVKNCVIQAASPYEEYGRGIYISDVSDVTIFNNTIINYQNYCFGVYASSSYSLDLSSNYLDICGSHSKGMAIHSSSDFEDVSYPLISFCGDDQEEAIYFGDCSYANVFSNQINCSGNEGYSFVVSNSNSFTVSDNNITLVGSDSSGVYSETASSMNFSNNILRDLGADNIGAFVYDSENIYFYDSYFYSRAYGIYSESSSNIYVFRDNFWMYDGGIEAVSFLDISNAEVSDNSFNLEGYSSTGVYSESCSYLDISRNYLADAGEATYLDAFVFNSVDGLIFSENNVSFFGAEMSTALTFLGVSLSNVSDNILNLFQDSSVAFSLSSGSESNAFFNNIINFSGNNSYAYYFSESSYNSIYDEEFNIDCLNCIGIYFGESSSENSFSSLDFDVSGIGSNAVSIMEGGNEFSFTDVLINSQENSFDLFIDEGVGSGRWSYVNSTLNKKYFDPSASGNLSVYYYLDVVANYSNGTVLGGENISIYNSLSEYLGSYLTNSEGVVGDILLPSYFQTDSVSLESFSNYTIVLEVGDSTFNESINLTGNKVIYFSFGDGTNVTIASVEGSEDSGSSSSSSFIVADCSGKWVCSDWSDCEGGTKFRTCTNLKSECSSTSPKTEKKCSDVLKRYRKFLFDVIIDMLEDTAGDDGEINSKITLINVGVNGKVDTTLYYEIVDSEGTIFYSEEEKIAVETQLEFIKTFDVASYPDGKYMVYVDLDYEAQEEPAQSMATFYVGEKPGIPFWIYLLAILIIILAAIIVYYLMKKRNKSEAYSSILSNLKKCNLENPDKSVYKSLKSDYNRLSEEEKEEIYPKIKDVFKLKFVIL